MRSRNCMTKSQRQSKPKIPKANPADVESIDAIIKAANESLSRPTGEKRTWNRARSLYFPGERLIPTGSPGEPHALAPNILDVDEFIARVEPYFAEHVFYE